MKERLLQKIADTIVKRVEESSDLDMLEFYYSKGIWFNDFCINVFNIELK